MNETMQLAIPTEQEVRSQLELILQSKEFSHSEKLRNFLGYVVEETLAGRGEQLKAYNIGVDVFGLGKNFDPGENTVVRVAAGRVRNKLERYYLKFSTPDQVYIKISKGSYLPSFSYFGKTMDPPDADVQTETRLAGQEAKSGIKQYRPTILVMPLSDLSEGKSLGSWLEGLSEEIAIMLNRYDEFVIYTTQNTQEQNEDVWTLAEKMHAILIINGSAQLQGHLIRLRVALIDAKTRYHVWSDKFEGDFDAKLAFDIQEEIATQLVSRIADNSSFINRIQLKWELDDSEFGLEVYKAMLFYHYWMTFLTPQHYIKAKAAMKKALRLEPLSASLKAMLAEVHATYYQWGVGSDPDVLAFSTKLAEEALELDGSSHYANWAKAYNCFLRRDKENFLYYANKALEINPSNAIIMASSAIRLIMIGERDKGVSMLEEALRLNPHVPFWHRSGPFINHYLDGDYEAALTEANHISAPGFLWGPLMRAAAYGQLGKLKEGHEELAELLELVPDFPDSGNRIMIKLFFQQSSVDKLMQGLRRAGLDV